MSVEEYANRTCHGGWMTEEYVPGQVSVIIPTYNRAKYLVEAMDSVLNQTYRPIELIVIDDGSADNTPQVIEQWSRPHADDEKFKLRYFRQEHRGACVARNRGLIESSGEFIQFLDSDDVYLPGKTAWGVQALGDSRYDFVYFGTRRCTANLEPLVEGMLGRIWRGRGWEVLSSQWDGNAALYRRSLLVKVGPWNEELTRFQDVEYAARVKLHSKNGVFDPRCGALWRQHNCPRVSSRDQSRAAEHLRNEETRNDSVLRLAMELGKMSYLLAARFRYRYLALACDYRRRGDVGSCLRCVLKCMNVRGLPDPCWFLAAFCRFLPNHLILYVFQVVQRGRRIGARIRVMLLGTCLRDAALSSRPQAPVPHRR